MTAAAFVDAEALLVAWLAANIAGPVATDTPADLHTLPVFTRIVRIGGPVVGVRTELARFDVDHFAPIRADAADAARTAQAALMWHAARARVTLPAGGDGVILAVSCETGPSWRPYADQKVYRFGATYGVTIQTNS